MLPSERYRTSASSPASPVSGSESRSNQRLTQLFAGRAWKLPMLSVSGEHARSRLGDLDRSDVRRSVRVARCVGVAARAETPCPRRRAPPRATPPARRRLNACLRPDAALARRARTLDQARGAVNSSSGRCENRAVHGHHRVDRKPAPRREAARAAGAARRFGERFGRLDDRLVFVVGSPRSGTTFLAGAIGSLPGFVDLGEVAPVKAAVPELAALAPDEAARAASPDPRRRTSRRARRRGARRRADAGDGASSSARIPLAYPEARDRPHRPRRPRRRLLAAREAVAPARAGERRRRRRPVRRVRALLGRARAARGVRDGERRAARGVGLAELRHGGARGRRTRSRSATRTMTADPAARRSRARAAPRRARSEPLAAALGRAHASSVGRYATDLNAEQLADVEAEAGGAPPRARLRAARPAPDAPSRGAPAARSSARGPRRRGRASACARGAGAGAPSPVRSSSASCAARASSSARSAVSSGSSLAGDEHVAEAAVHAPSRSDRPRARRARGRATDGRHRQRARRARAGRPHRAAAAPPSRSRRPPPRAGASPASVSRGRSSRSASSRSASCRSGESSAFASTSRARTNPSWRSAERSISRRTR